ncbi:hypothetical protein AUEXF2481DRAFT_1926 [Aureobasidium subglaciale EXF-2481]|uniref:Uncharacterized protein n=1 Tax=Aureobasidium subglaciale (strain EXF-2481) TaxID=1043005 RepID=A0A074YSK7_AURSE|nr:uncharacterized protein AUEXF2481DRAFT_1926 [Aureobasidium subglaciale EXF-2481]KAI5207705.1 hypothetical protein E4T38_03176 [Aureobasidium subglaciale]KAI5226494.1 hypothetical protein E4T40_02950 [Aureobasidium subglaciale]KAI5229858.1 hypothetical protein E4T41_03173 [Aureobasidium subglaciale]KAI5264362.1 hypothetical protein E4T46_02951 [Aureobasidium subglaciale]KEQ99109.1 hypothetical protein AUEXF2481DRAFT_1926 [Aureobasidium subglaciale EXF-2481]
MEQDVYLKNVVKVLLRFPGLVMEPSEIPGVDFQANGDGYSKFPFEDRDPVKPNYPYEKLRDLFALDDDREDSKTVTKRASKRASKRAKNKANKKQKSGRAARSGPRVDEEDDEEQLDENGGAVLDSQDLKLRGEDGEDGQD